MTNTLIEKLARHCAQTVVGMKGVQRDRAVMVYWNGAIGALDAVGDMENRDWVARVGWMLLSARGYSEIERILGKTAA